MIRSAIKSLGGRAEVLSTVLGLSPGTLELTLEERRQAAWLRSMRGERQHQHKGWKVLDVVMMWSVGTALFCMAIWFFFFAGSSLPGS